MKQKLKGYTLVELMLIVSIVLLLAAIILVNFSTIRVRAQRSAMLSEAGAIVRAMELCTLAQNPIYCGGNEGSLTSSANCTGDGNAVPISDTAICGNAGVTSTWSEHTWPNVEKNGYTYGSHAGSNVARGYYVFSLFRDIDKDNVPDDSTLACCSSAFSGCQERRGALATPASCRTSAGFGAISED